jgi:hypothetical protein
LITILIRILYSTGAGVLLYELIANIAIVGLIWYSLVTLHRLGLSRRAVNIIAAVYAFYPMYFFIANFVTKDQLFSAVVFALAIQFYKLIYTKSPGWKHFLIIGSLFGLAILLKTFFAVLILAFVFLIIAAKRFWKPLSIAGVSGLVLAFVIQIGLVNALGAESIASHDLLSVPIQASGAIFNDPNANISDEERAYYDGLYDNDYFRELNPDVDPKDWYKRYIGLMSDNLKFPLWYVDMNIPEYLAKTLGLCFKNFGTCLSSYFTLMSGWFAPIEISFPVTGQFRNPTFSQYTSDIGDNFVSTKTNGINSERICPTAEPETPPLTFDEYKTCLIETLGESQGVAVADSVQPFIRDSLLANSILPGLGQWWLDVWHFLKFFVEGFWVFWTAVALLIICFVRKKYARIRPMVGYIFAIYIGLFLVAPVAYERYIIPIYLILPFLIGTFLVEKKRSTARVNKKR